MELTSTNGRGWLLFDHSNSDDDKDQQTYFCFMGNHEDNEDSDDGNDSDPDSEGGEVNDNTLNNCFLDETKWYEG